MTEINSINAILINLGNKKVLLPNTVIAEIFKVNSKELLTENQKDYHILWREQKITVLQEKDFFDPASTDLNNSNLMKYYIAIINTVVENPKHPFIGLLFQNLPKVISVASEDLKFLGPQRQNSDLTIPISYKERNCWLLNLELLF